MTGIKELLENLQNGGYDARLSQVYCKTGAQLDPARQRIFDVVNCFAETFHADPSTKAAVFSAAGRTEIGGNHTDHQRGRVLTGSVDLDAIACAAPNGTTAIRLFSRGYGLITVDFSRKQPLPEEKNTTASLIRGVAARIEGMGYPVSGFDAYMVSDVPGGSGLSSSACFEVLVGTIINGLFCGNALPMPEIAKIGQYAENVFFGKPSGLMDQMGCAVGGLVSIDFADKENPVYHAVNFDFAAAGYALCIIDTGADHADLTDDYSAMPIEMCAVAREIGHEVLSEVNESDFFAQLPALRKKLGDRAVLRAMHFFEETDRVPKQVAALEAGDFEGFLRLINESGTSSWKYLQNVSTGREPKEQPVAVALALAEHYLGGTGASRVHGGGLAGTIQAFVPLNKVEAFRAGMDSQLAPGACRVTSIRPVGGCVLAD